MSISSEIPRRNRSADLIPSSRHLPQRRLCCVSTSATRREDSQMASHTKRLRSKRYLGNSAKRGERLKLDERGRYVVFVLWLHGFAFGQIARVIHGFTGVMLTTDQVWGLVRNSPYARRSSMSISERQTHLDILAQHRLDGSRLPADVFRAKELTGAQR